jgi:hypothetical protein
MVNGWLRNKDDQGHAAISQPMMTGFGHWHASNGMRKA